MDSEQCRSFRATTAHNCIGLYISCSEQAAHKILSAGKLKWGDCGLRKGGTLWLDTSFTVAAFRSQLCTRPAQERLLCLWIPQHVLVADILSQLAPEKPKTAKHQTSSEVRITWEEAKDVAGAKLPTLVPRIGLKGELLRRLVETSEWLSLPIEDVTPMVHSLRTATPTEPLTLRDETPLALPSHISKLLGFENSPSTAAMPSTATSAPPAVRTRQKRRRMKTAEEIYKRIQWDTSLSRSEFVIGYLDRFRGIVETSFDNFVTLETEVYTNTGVPLHRIRYFKLNDVKVWDRDARIDILTFPGDTEELPRELHSGEPEADVADDKMLEEMEKEERAQEETAEHEEGMLIDNEPTVPSVPAALKPAKVAFHKYFVGIRLRGEAVQRMAEFQEQLVARNPALLKLRIDPRKFHVTLAVISLPPGTDPTAPLGNAMREGFAPRLAEVQLRFSALRFAGVEMFGKSVLYARIAEREHHDYLATIAKALETYFVSPSMAERGVKLVAGARKFTPHVTLFKTGYKKRRKDRALPGPLEEVLAEMDATFGHAISDTLELSYMDKKDEDGYYRAIDKIMVSTVL